MKNVFKRIFKTLLTSLLVTFFAMLVLMIGNKIMGVERVGIVYLLLGGLCFSMLFVGLIFARQDYIFNKTPKRTSRRPVKKEVQRTKTPQNNIQRNNKRSRQSVLSRHPGLCRHPGWYRLCYPCRLLVE